MLVTLETVEEARSYFMMLISSKRVGECFTSDELFFKFRFVDVSPKIVGTWMNLAHKSGLCEKTGNWTPSVRPSCHKRPIMVWRRVALEEKNETRKCAVVGDRGVVRHDGFSESKRETQKELEAFEGFESEVAN